MIRMWPRTLGGQLLALLLGALVLSQVVSFVVYSSERADALRTAERSGLIEAAATVMRVLQQAPLGQRAVLARAASSGRIQIWATDASAIDPASATAGDVQFQTGLPTPLQPMFPDQLRDSARWQVLRGAGVAPVPPPRGNIPGSSFIPFAGDRYDVLLSIPFRDGGWLNAQTQIRAEPVTWAWPSLISTLVMALAILLIVFVTTRRATSSLKVVAARADALGRGTADPPIAPEGPDEVRRVMSAFNRMQERLQRFVTDRTRMIAAIGHDLRTPITSLRLRAELLDDDDTKTRMVATLDEMQRMVDATLAFAREEATAEEARTVDLSALIASIVDDRADLGQAVSFADPGRLPYRCRPTALRRAIDNLVGNAVQYGGGARVSLGGSAAGVVIGVDDDGPGIPADRMEDVFQPFVRIETSRSRDTGGVGLGLSIARSIVLAHGGEISLGNRPGGGLRAEIHLPPGGTEARPRRGASEDAENPAIVTAAGNS